MYGFYRFATMVRLGLSVQGLRFRLQDAMVYVNVGTVSRVMHTIIL